MREHLPYNESTLVCTPQKICILEIIIASQFSLIVEVFYGVQRCHVVNVEKKLVF
jgi:hypothetical protein